MLEKIKARIFAWKPVVALLKLSKEIKVPGFEGYSLYDIALYIITGFSKSKLVTRASAISFKLILALAPTLIMFVSLIPYLPIENFQDTLIQGVADFLPQDAAQLITSTFTDLISYKHDTFLSITFVLGLFYASNSVKAIFEGFSGAYFLQEKLNPLKSRLIAVAMVFLLPLFLLPAFLIITFSETALSYLLEKEILKAGYELTLVLVVKWTTVVLFIYIAVTTLYNVGNTNRKSWKFFTPGATLASLSFLLVSQGFAWYVNHFGNYSKFYGSLGTIVVLLLWLQINCILLLVGFELNISIQRAKNLKRKGKSVELSEVSNS